MGLLDGIFDSEGGRLGLGLLAAGSARADGAGAGQRLAEAIGSVDQWKQQQALAKRQAMQEQFMQFQMEQAKAQAADVEKRKSIFASNFSPEITASADGFGPVRPMQFDHENAAMQLGRAGMGEAALDLMSRFGPKPADYKVVGNSLVQVGQSGVKPVYTDQKEAPKTELAKYLDELDKLPPNSPLRKVYEQQIQKLTTHQAPVSVSYGAPVAGVDAQGNPIFFQPGKNGGAPAIIPGVAPANAGPKLTEDQAKAQGWLAQAENAYANMMKAKKDEPGAEYPGAADAVAKIPLVGGPAANAMRTSARQRYMQAASSFSEAALRAATGAGMNEYEARQKVAQFTPGFMDSAETIKQKESDMQVFLKTLKPRATGRAANDSPRPTEQIDQSDPLGLFKR